MNLSHLYYFTALAEHPNYTDVSKMLHVSQPTLSEAMHHLESELGIKLFQKDGRNVKLTKYGIEFSGYVNRALEHLNEGIRIAQERGGKRNAKVTLGAVYTIESNYLPELMTGFRYKSSGRIDLIIHQGVTDTIIPRIKSGELDLGFCSYVPNEPALSFFPVLTQQYVVIVNKSHRMAAKDCVSPEELKGSIITSYNTQTQVGIEVQNLLEKHQLSITQGFDSELMIAGIMHHNKDDAAIVLKTPSIESDPAISVLEINDANDWAHQVCLVYKNGCYLPEPVATLINYAARRELIPIV